MRKYCKSFFKVGWYIIFCYFFWILRYSKHPEKYPIELRFKRTQKLCKKVLLALGCKFYEKGCDDFYNNEHKDNNLIICNHQAAADPLVIISLAKKPVTFVAKKEVEKTPFIGKIIKSIDGFFIDRGNLRAEFKTIQDVEKQLIEKNNLDIVIFPEGTRNTKSLTETLEFKHGALRPAFKANKSIKVCSIFGTYRILTKKIYYKKLAIQLNYLDYYNNYDLQNSNTVDISNKSKEIIDNELKYLEENDRVLMKMLNRKFPS